VERTYVGSDEAYNGHFEVVDAGVVVLVDRNNHMAAIMAAIMLASISAAP